MFVDVVFFIGGSQYFTLIDIVHAQCFENLRFHKVANARFGHDRNCDRRNNLLDLARVTHTRHTAILANVGRHAFKRHNRTRAGFLGNARLLCRDDIHNDSALEHLRQTRFYDKRACNCASGAIIIHCTHLRFSFVLMHDMHYSSRNVRRKLTTSQRCSSLRRVFQAGITVPSRPWLTIQNMVPSLLPWT